MSGIYRKEFEDAVERTKRMGFPVQPRQVPQTLNALNTDHAPALLKALEHELGGMGGLHPESIAFNCLQVSAAMQGHIYRLAGLATELTIGGVDGSGGPIWSVDESSLGSLMQTGAFHVWLTVSPVEIADFTLIVSLKLQRDGAVDGVQPIVGNPDTMGSFRWRPVVVGRDAAAGLVGLS